ncbi:Rieske (2Fe-2S) protein [uncultured Endozoicomonas sp.]|uniref:Rieske (2Fe-2S) protein n=1 Tax=uncultured Endozoicomonas sp. TaxID=432652 RepID=UPI002638451A|nr:Rieske (2Fe-2S) protein [uncultured Endozoicomonas sp.]
MIRLCAVNDLDDPGSKGFHNERGHLFAVRQGQQVFVYVNSCPHFGINLEWQPDQFLDSEKRLIQCATHGAQFLIETGECIAGPCPGDQLTSVECEVRDGVVYLP